MTKEVFIQQFEKEFTVYEQVQLIKKYINELDIPTDLDYLPKKTLSININDEQLAQVFIDKHINSCLLNDRYVVGKVYTPKGPTTNESYVFYLYDLTKGSRKQISKFIRGTKITYNNTDTYYLTSQATENNVEGLLHWGRRSEYDSDLSFEITLRDLDANNISGELLIGNYATYMTNHYWTIGLDEDVLNITCDVEGGMGIIGSRYQTETSMKMYAKDNLIEITSDEGIEIAGNNNRIVSTGLTGYRKTNRFEVRQDGIYINNRCMYKQVNFTINDFVLDDEDDLYKYYSINFDNYGVASETGLYITTNSGMGDYHIFNTRVDDENDIIIWSFESNENVKENGPFTSVSFGGTYDDLENCYLSFKVHKTNLNDNSAFDTNIKFVIEFEPISWNPSTIHTEY